MMKYFIKLVILFLTALSLATSCKEGVITTTPSIVTPFTITSIGNTIFSISKFNSPREISLEYKKGNADWDKYYIGVEIELSDGETLQFRAGEQGNDTFSEIVPTDSYYSFNFYTVSVRGTGNIRVSGNVMSLLDSTCQRNDVPSNAFYWLFADCDKLVDASQLLLPATKLAESCYSCMFSDCESLTSAPALPATKLAESCYTCMFSGCESLTSAPALPATELATNCYYSMFSCCESLTSAPALPATELATNCYYGMFRGCKNLTSAPALPATKLAESCYSCMFSGCESLTSAPALPALELARDCYGQMFEDCKNLKYVDALFIKKSDYTSTFAWLYGVSPTGVFVRNKNATWTREECGIPEGWEIIDK